MSSLWKGSALGEKRVKRKGEEIVWGKGAGGRNLGFYKTKEKQEYLC